MTAIARIHWWVKVTIASGANLSDPIDFSRAAGGMVIMPAAWTAASIGFKTALTKAGTYQPYKDDNANLVQVDGPVAAENYSFPADLFPAGWVKLWSQDGSAANTNQGAERILYVEMKG